MPRLIQPRPHWPAAARMTNTLAAEAWKCRLVTMNQQIVAPVGRVALAMAPQPQIEISVVLPCLNEALTLERCITRAGAAIAGMSAIGEIMASFFLSTMGLARR